MIPAGVAVLAVLAVFGAMSLLRDLCCCLLRRGAPCDSVLIDVRGSSESVEGTVRSLMLKNPNAEIIIVDEGKSREMREILDRLCRECAQVHIERVEVNESRAT